jgi:putative CocE/NonD family hydrolase
MMVNRRRTWSLAIAGVAASAMLAPATARAQQTTPCDQESHTYAKVSRAPRYAALPQEVVSIPSTRDGVSIQIGIVRPKVPAGTRVPVIVDAGPYYNPMQTLDLRACEPRLTENFVPQGYAVALVAVRGTGDSGGCMDLFGPGERADLNQAITWLAQRPWSSGAVGMTGKSYDGSTPWEVASFGNPHLKTIVPLEGVTDVFDLLFGHGTPDWRGPLVLNDIYYLQSVLFYMDGRSPENTVGVTACPDYATGSAASAYSAQTGQVDPWGYWTVRRYRPAVERRYRGSVFLVQGLQDWNVNPGQQFPWIGRLARRGVYVKQLLGQWGHSYPDEEDPPSQRLDWPDLLLAWFDRWLKGDDVALGPRVEVEDARGHWRTESSWPPPGTAQRLWLTGGGGLAGEPAGEPADQTLGPDPAHLQGGGVLDNEPPAPLEEQCAPGTCAAFSTAPLGAAEHVAGLPRARLTVTPSGPAGELSGYLYAVTDAGAHRVGWGQADLRFPHGEDDPQPVTPGRPMTVDLNFQALDDVVPRGARLVLVVGEGSAYNRLPSTPNAPVALSAGGRASSLSYTAVG